MVVQTRAGDRGERRERTMARETTAIRRCRLLGVHALLKKEDTLDELPALVQRLLPPPRGAGGGS